MPEKYENAALFLRLGLPSTLIGHENGGFQKRSSNQAGGISKRWLCVLLRTETKHFQNEAFGKR